MTELWCRSGKSCANDYRRKRQSVPDKGFTLKCWQSLESIPARRMFEAQLFTLPRIWEELLRDCNYYGRLAAIQDFNKASAWRKRGISITPCR